MTLAEADVAIVERDVVHQAGHDSGHVPDVVDVAREVTGAKRSTMGVNDAPSDPSRSAK